MACEDAHLFMSVEFLIFFFIYLQELLVPVEKFSVRMPMYSSMARGPGCNRRVAGLSPIIGMSRNVLHVKSK